MAYIPSGRELIDPFTVVKQAGLRSGQKTADFGCGTLGHIVFPAAEMVGPDGTVYAVDILRSVLDGVANRAKMEGIGNVEPLWGDIERDRGINLPDGSLDAAFLVNNLFLSSHKETLFKECVRTVKSGGALVLVEWKPSGVSFGPLFATRVAAVETLKLAQAAGLVPESEFEPGKYHYGYVFRKP